MNYYCYYYYYFRILFNLCVIYYCLLANVNISSFLCSVIVGSKINYVNYIIKVMDLLQFYSTLSAANSWGLSHVVCFYIFIL